jgi:hypothetical protein
MYKFKIIFLSVFCFFTIQAIIPAQEMNELTKVDAIVNLTRFVDWSQNESFNHSDKKLYIIAKNNLFENVQSNIRNNRVYRDWKIVCSEKILNFEDGSVVFITKSKVNYGDEIIRISGEKDILTISDNTSDFCKKGGMINIKENNGQIKFEINYRIIQNKSLDISSKLLALSKIYE